MTSYTNTHSFPFASAFADFLAFLTRLCELMDLVGLGDCHRPGLGDEIGMPSTWPPPGPSGSPHSRSRRRRKTSRARAAHGAARGKYYVVNSPGGILGNVDLYSLGFLCYETLCRPEFIHRKDYWLCRGHGDCLFGCVGVLLPFLSPVTSAYHSCSPFLCPTHSLRSNPSSFLAYIESKLTLPLRPFFCPASLSPGAPHRHLRI
jgi:hypothetical protein